MTQINWGIAGMARDPGQAFAQSFDMGRQQRMESDKRNALSAYAQNPQDANALNALMGVDPMMGMQIQQRQQQSQQQGLEAHRDTIIRGGQIFRQLNVQDEASYQAALGMARQMGLPVDQVPPNYDPQYVNGVVALADTFAPNAAAKPTALQQNYEFLSSQNPELGQSYLKRQAEGSPFIMVNGIPHMWTDGGGNEAPPVLTDEDILRMEGGQPGANPTGGFQP